MGCYHVDAQYYFKTIDNNKESECKNACAGDDRIYFAMRGIFCACFNTLPFGSEVISLPETSCTVPCPGRVQETCGGISDSGTYPYSVFKTGAAYQGCYKVTDSSPEVTQSYPDGEDQKSAWCKTECENRKYMYGLVDAPYCTCVNVYQAMTVKVAESECEIGSGTGNQGGINGVKALMKTNFDPRGNDENFKLVDKKCYNPMSLTVGFLVSNRYAASCIKECSERGYSVAAAQMFSNNYLLCYCDRGIQSYAINKDWCTEECFDDKDCGGDSAHTLYQAVCRQAFGLGTTLAFTMEHRSKLYTRVGEEVPWAFNLEEDNTGIVSSTIGEILDPLETQPRFIVTLGTYRLIRSIKYSGHPVEPTGVTGFKMAFSDDGVSYTFLYNTDTYDSKTIEPADMSKIGEGVIEEHLFADIIVTQYVQILVTAFKDFPTFRVELYGCVDTY